MLVQEISGEEKLNNYWDEKSKSLHEMSNRIESDYISHWKRKNIIRGE